MRPRLFIYVATSGLALGLGAVPAWAELRYSGSDTVEPVVEAARTAFQRSAPGFKLAVQSSGSSVGLRDLCGGRAALVGSSRQIKPEETKECERAGVTPLEVPVAMDAVVLVVSAKNTQVRELKLAEVKQIFEPASTGRVTSWKAVRADWPDMPLKPVGVNIKHGTFEFFHGAIGNGKFTRSDIKDTAQHEDTAKLVAADAGALGYVPLSVARDFSAQLRTVPIDFGQGPVEPTPQNIAAGRYGALSRTVYLYVNGPAVLKEGPEAERFVKEMVGGLEKFATFANMTALGAPQYQDSVRRVNFRK